MKYLEYVQLCLFLWLSVLDSSKETIKLLDCPLHCLYGRTNRHPFMCVDYCVHNNSRTLIGLSVYIITEVK